MLMSAGSRGHGSSASQGQTPPSLLDTSARTISAVSASNTNSQPYTYVPTSPEVWQVRPRSTEYEREGYGAVPTGAHVLISSLG